MCNYLQTVNRIKTCEAKQDSMCHFTPCVAYIVAGRKSLQHPMQENQTLVHTEMSMSHCFRRTMDSMSVQHGKWCWMGRNEIMLHLIPHYDHNTPNIFTRETLAKTAGKFLP